MATSKKIKWGIIGCGNIAHKFVDDLALIKDAELTAVASRNSDKAQSFAKKHHAKISYGSYDELFMDASIDIVYIATPHTSHAALSIKAMEHDKHVLCEKPLALNKKEVTAMIDASRRTNRFFMEALWTRFNPCLVEIKKRIDNGEIGQIKYINADFAFRVDKPLEGRVLNLNLGGGALLDIGIYPTFLTYLFLGVPKEILAQAIFHEVTKCDTQTSMVFHYEDAQAILSCSFTSKSDMIARISGTNGQIYLHDTWHLSQGFTLVKGDDEEVFEIPTVGMGYSHEIVECHNCINGGNTESEYWSHQNSLALISILDDVRKKIDLVYPQESLS